MDPSSFLSGADVAMVAVTMVLVQFIKFFLPSPAPEFPGAAVKRWSVEEGLRFVPFISAFIFGVTLSILFDQHSHPSIRLKIKEGLQTGAYSVVAWEAYSQTVARVIARIKAGT